MTANARSIASRQTDAQQPIQGSIPVRPMSGYSSIFVLPQMNGALSWEYVSGEVRQGIATTSNLIDRSQDLLSIDSRRVVRHAIENRPVSTAFSPRLYV